MGVGVAKGSGPDGPAGEVGPRNVGILGGTFDPVHLGHVAWAQRALWALHLDQVIFMVAGDPWMKSGSGRAVTPGLHRLEMVRLAIGGRTGLTADGRELRRAGPTYTVDTLEELSAEGPASRLHLLVGSDCLRELADWSRPERLLELAALVVMPRPGSPADLGCLDTLVPGAREKAFVLTGEEVTLSSSDIRTRIGTGSLREGELDGAVASYIGRNGLYL